MALVYNFGRGVPTVDLRIAVVVGSVGMMLSLSGAEGAAESSIDAMARGKALYERYCADCHGVTGHGDGPRAALLAPRPGNLVSAGTSSKTDPELLRILRDGVPRTAMKGWKDQLSERDRRDVLAYIRSLIHFQDPPLTPPPPDSRPH